MSTVHFRLVAAVLIVCLSLTNSIAKAEVKFRHQPEGARIILFVHGLWSDPDTAFGSWPELIKSDMDKIRGQVPLSQYAIATVGYKTSPDSGLSISDIANNLVLELQYAGIFDNYNEIYFVAHSLGGIAVQEMLLNDHAIGTFRLLAKTRAVFFLSAPSHGAPIANFATALGNIFGNRMVVDLRTISDNTYLQTISNKWRGILANPERATKLKAFCAYETKPYKLLTIVAQQHAELNCDPGTVLAANEDHISIASPRSRSDSVYTWVRGQIAGLHVASNSKAPKQPKPPDDEKKGPSGSSSTIGGESQARSGITTQSLPENPKHVIERKINSYAAGKGYITYHNTAWAECSRLCGSDSACQMIEHFKPSNECNLYAQSRPAGESSSADIGLKVLSSVPANRGYNMQKLVKRYVEGKGFRKVINSSFDDCQNRCGLEPRCKMFEFYPPKSECNLYNHANHLGKETSPALVGLKLSN